MNVKNAKKPCKGNNISRDRIERLVDNLIELGLIVILDELTPRRTRFL